MPVNNGVFTHHGGPPPAYVWTFLRSNSGVPTRTVPASVTIDTRNSSLLVIAFSGGAGNGVIDPLGNTWAPLTGWGIVPLTQIFVCINPGSTSAAHTLTSFDVNTPMAMGVFSSTGPSPALDAEIGAFVLGASILSVGPFAPSGNADLLLSAAMTVDYPFAPTIDSGFTIAENTPGGIETGPGFPPRAYPGVALAFKIKNNSVSETLTWDWGVAQSNVAASLTGLTP